MSKVNKVLSVLWVRWQAVAIQKNNMQHHWSYHRTFPKSNGTSYRGVVATWLALSVAT